jgi:hypothetical protein
MEPMDFVTYEGGTVKAGDIDMRAMVTVSRIVHKAYRGPELFALGPRR